MALYLTEGDVGRLLSMEACVEAVETAFRQWADGRADNRPRARASVRGAVLHALAAGSEAWGRLAAKVYATSREGARFMVLLFDARTAGLLAAIEADRLGQTRTGAASGVASRWLARKDARSLAIIGTGWQARSQAKAIATVRRLEIIRVFGRSPERLREFCRDAEAACGVRVTPCASAEEAVRGADIIVTATSAAQPVLQGAWLRPGTHVNAVGSNRAVELKEIIAGRHPGRSGDPAITLFKSLGIGLEDLAAASLVYDRAVEAGAGKPLPSKGERDD